LVPYNYVLHQLIQKYISTSQKFGDNVLNLISDIENTLNYPKDKLLSKHFRGRTNNEIIDQHLTLTKKDSFIDNNITTENWSSFINYDIKNIGVVEGDEDGGGIEFADEKTQEYQELIEAQVAAAHEGKGPTLATEDEEGEIDVDDI
jgi:hypothetical protein